MNHIEVDIHTVKQWLQQGSDTDGNPVVLVDCREPHEFETAKIEGAVLMPMRSWPPSQSALEALAGKSIVVHCHHGGRSLRVANWFRENGYPDAKSMAGGIDAWSLEIDNSIPRY
jgi:rhodanese-related sulfurtransferase